MPSGGNIIVVGTSEYACESKTILSMSIIFRIEESIDNDSFHYRHSIGVTTLDCICNKLTRYINCHQKFYVRKTIKIQKKNLLFIRKQKIFFFTWLAGPKRKDIIISIVYNNLQPFAKLVLLSCLADRVI